MTKLKECPFCGSEASGEFGGDGLGFIQYFIECSNQCEVCPSVRGNNKHDAAKAWNSRADSSVATEQNKELVEALRDLCEEYKETCELVGWGNVCAKYPEDSDEFNNAKEILAKHRE